MRRVGFGWVALPFLATPALAQQGTFDSGSTGVDGALTLAASLGTIDFDPTDQARYGRVLDQDGDNTYHFTAISIGAGTTLRLRTTHLPEGRPVVWLASGDVKIEGILDLDGNTGHDWNASFNNAHAGAGGYTGGVGNAPGTPGQNGNGPGGGATGTSADPWGGNAAHVIAGAVNNQPTGGAPYGNVHVRPMVGGSGGGGALIWSGRVGSGGGGGGGAIVIASSSRIDVPGTIRARGGNGGARQDSSAVNGGAGSGGAVRLIAPTVQGTGSINVAGGTAPVVNTAASHGRVRIEAYKNPTMPSVVPGQALARSAPSAVFLTETAPLVRVVRVAGVAVAANPTGSFVVPDVAITSAGSVTVELEARNIPGGTVLNLTFQPENANPFTATSTPLTLGTGGVLTATANVTFQGGFTRVFVRANWTP